MKTFKTFVSLFAIVAVFSAGADAQDAVEVSADVVHAISVTTDTDVSFGDVDNNADATISAGPNDVTADANAGTPVYGEVAITQLAPSQTIVVSWNDNDVELALSTDAGTVLSFNPTVYSATTEAELATPAGSSIPLGGAQTTETLYVGGVLASTGATSGNYSTGNSGGTPITITVNYN